MSSHIATSVLAFMLFLAFTADVGAGQLIPYERTAEGGDNSVADLHKKVYGDEQIDTSSALAINRWNAFKYFQYALAEMMVDPTDSDRSRKEFQQNRSVMESNMNNPNPKGWGFMYWNRGQVDAQVPLADGSGKVARTTTFGTAIGMDGKNLYFPDDAVLDKMVQIMTAQQELGKNMGPSDGQPQDVLDKYNADAQKLEQEFLATVAGELPKVKAAAKGGKVYGLGLKYDENDNIQPLELNLSMIESQLRRLGVPIKDPAEAAAATPADPIARSAALASPAITVRQPKSTVQELNQDYDAMTSPFLDETSRTRAEVEKDMLFRMRTRPKDIQQGVKTYDILLSPELSASGLSLPSRQPGNQ